MSFKNKKQTIPDLVEFVDPDGKKWIQTSPDDLLSLKELGDVLEAVEKDKKENGIVLARIDFQNVTREYYELAISLQERLERQNALLQKVTADAKGIIERKNVKLRELVVYIKKLHLYLASMQSRLDAAGLSVTPPQRERGTGDVAPDPELERSATMGTSNNTPSIGDDGFMEIDLADISLPDLPPEPQARPAEAPVPAATAPAANVSGAVEEIDLEPIETPDPALTAGRPGKSASPELLEIDLEEIK